MPLRTKITSVGIKGASEKYRPGYPKTGSFSPWDTDEIQNLVMENRRILIYPGHCNTLEFKATPETFGTVPIQSPELSSLVEEKAHQLGKVELTRSLQYLARKQGVLIPFLPIVTMAEKKTFRTLLSESAGAFDPSALAVRWIEKVDGSEILPKKKFLVNRQIERANREVRPQLEDLQLQHARWLQLCKDSRQCRVLWKIKTNSSSQNHNCNNDKISSKKKEHSNKDNLLMERARVGPAPMVQTCRIYNMKLQQQTKTILAWGKDNIQRKQWARRP